MNRFNHHHCHHVTAPVLPCVELPTRCFLTHITSDQRLSLSPDSSFFLSSNWLPWEEWTIQIANDGSGCGTGETMQVHLYCAVHNLYLGIGSNGTSIETQKGEEAATYTKWQLVLTQPHDTIVCGIVCAEKKLQLLWNADHHHLELAPVVDNDFKNIKSEWRLGYQTGELCFISHAKHDRRIQCNILGILTMDKNWKGWEVWRFIDVEDSRVLITSWTHDQKVLCSNPEGHVFTTENKSGSWERWRVRKSKSNTGIPGVVIQSVEHGRVLVFDGAHLCTVEEDYDIAMWQLEAAHSQQYFLSSRCHNQRISTNGHDVCASKHRDAWEKWRIVLAKKEEGLVSVAIQNAEHESHDA